MQKLLLVIQAKKEIEELEEKMDKVFAKLAIIRVVGGDESCLIPEIRQNRVAINKVVKKLEELNKREGNTKKEQLKSCGMMRISFLIPSHAK
jgi:tetrahydromethanopterin S-methyltransferase subunit G